MKRPLALVLALVLLGGLAWLGRTFLDGTVPVRGATPAAGPVAPAAAALPTPAAADVERARPSAGEATVESRVALREETREGPRAARTLRVVEAESGNVVPGARVLWAELDAREDWQGHPSWILESCDAWLAEHGREAQSRADGTLELDLPEASGANVLALAEGLAGRLHVAAQDEQVLTVELVRDTALEVLVQDGRGAPVPGVTLGIQRIEQTWGRSFSSRKRATDADGHARFPHIGLDAALSRERFGVRAVGVLGAPAAVEIDPAALPDGPVVIEVPSTGVVDVRVLAGELVSEIEGRDASLLFDSGVEDERLSFWTRPESIEVSIEGGRARFPHVALGRDLIVEVGSSFGGAASRLRLHGPTRPGQVVEATLTLGRDHPVLRAQVRDASGRALAGHEVRWRVEGVGPDMDNQARTAADGVLELHLAARAASGTGRKLSLDVSSRDGLDGGLAQVELPDELSLGVNELGEVRVEAGKILVAGIVRGVDGTPRAGAEVHVDAVRVWGEDNRYHEDLELGITSAADGTFVARGAADTPTLRVAASLEGRSSRSVECDVGAAGLVLELIEPGTVAGRVLLDEDLDATRLQVTLVSAEPGGEHDWRDRPKATLAADGSFLLEDVRPELWTLRLGTQRGSGELVALERLEVPSGGPCSDPRLAAIDLRGRLLAFEVELVTPDAGDRLMGTLLAAPVGAGGVEDVDSIFVSGARTMIVVEARAVDLTMDLVGFRRVELTDVRSDVRVELRRGLPVRLRLADDVPLPSPPVYLKAFLAPEGSSNTVGHFVDSVFDARREVLVHAPAAGRMRVQWLIEERSESMLSTSGLPETEPTFVDLLDIDGEQVFEVAPPPGSLPDQPGDDL